jgi:hypothetical protein
MVLVEFRGGIANGDREQFPIHVTRVSVAISDLYRDGASMTYAVDRVASTADLVVFVPAEP